MSDTDKPQVAAPDHAAVAHTTPAQGSPLSVPKEGVDMRWVGHGPGQNSTQLGYERNAEKFWTKYFQKYPDHISPENLWRMWGSKDFRSPHVDDTWIQGHPAHAPYQGQVIEHHHVGQGSRAVPMPEEMHDAYGVFHPRQQTVANGSNPAKQVQGLQTNADYQGRIDYHVNKSGHLQSPNPHADWTAPKIPPNSPLATVPPDQLRPVDPHTGKVIPAPDHAGAGAAQQPPHPDAPVHPDAPAGAGHGGPDGATGSGASAGTGGAGGGGAPHGPADGGGAPHGSVAPGAPHGPGAGGTPHGVPEPGAPHLPPGGPGAAGEAGALGKIAGGAAKAVDHLGLVASLAAVGLTINDYNNAVNAKFASPVGTTQHVDLEGSLRLNHPMLGVAVGTLLGSDPGLISAGWGLLGALGAKPMQHMIEVAPGVWERAGNGAAPDARQSEMIKSWKDPSVPVGTVKTTPDGVQVTKIHADGIWVPSGDVVRNPDFYNKLMEDPGHVRAPAPMPTATPASPAPPPGPPPPPAHPHDGPAPAPAPTPPTGATNDSTHPQGDTSAKVAAGGSVDTGKTGHDAGQAQASAPVALAAPAGDKASGDGHAGQGHDVQAGPFDASHAPAGGGSSDQVTHHDATAANSFDASHAPQAAGHADQVDHHDATAANSFDTSHAPQDGGHSDQVMHHDATAANSFDAHHANTASLGDIHSAPHDDFA